MKGVLDALTEEGGAFASVKDAIADTNLSDVGVPGAKLYLLSMSEAQPYKNFNFSGAQYGGWWLRSPGILDDHAAFVLGEDGRVSFDGNGVSLQSGVRPALKLHLSSVIFSSESKTFSLKPSHTHSFTYSASGATITATCTATGCDLPEVESKHVATLSIAASGGTYDGTTAYGATITDTNSIQGDAKVQYQKKTGESYGTATETAPKDAGDYKASITVGGATASVEYTIAKANPTANAPIGLTATYGQTLANVTLTNPEGNTPGRWAWENAPETTTVGDAGENTFQVNFTPTDTKNYNTVSSNVTVTVGKANPTANPPASTATYGQALSQVALENPAGNTAGSWTWADNTQNVGNAGSHTFKASFTPGDTTNYNTVSDVDVTVTVNKQEVAAPEITSKVYTGEKLTADVPDSTLYEIALNQGGTAVGEYPVVLALKDPANYKWPDSNSVSLKTTFQITQATAPAVTVPTPEAVTYDPNNTLAKVTLPRDWTWANSATVPTVDNSGYEAVLGVDDTNYDYTGVEGYSETAHAVTRTVALTVYKAAPTVTAPTAKTLTYTGFAQALVTAGEATGGEMQYALGTETEATQPYTTSIPTATDAGIYYVWYKLVGDGNHTDIAAACVTVRIIPFGPASFTLPAATKTLGESAFEGDTSVTIVDAQLCAALGANAFKGCTNLTQIRLPKDCSIDATAFTGCTGLSGIFAPAGGTTETWCKNNGVAFFAEQPDA